MQTPNFTLLDVEEYRQALLKNLPNAKERIVLAAMVVLWGDRTEAIFAEVNKALERGVRVHILLDNYTRINVFDNLDAPRIWRQHLKKTILLLENMRHAGARVSYVGRIGLNPFKGRCHTKITVVDDECFSFGGVNLEDPSFNKTDYMLHAQNRELADCLEQLVSRIAHAKNTLPDAVVKIDETSSILFDGGKQKDSIIYDRAVKLASKSRRIYFVSQFTPSDKLTQVLSTTNTTYYFNDPSQMNVPARWGQAFDQKRHRIPNSYSQTKYIHAKFILFELKNGERALLSGSHNFSYRGVKYGTKEISLYSTDTKLWEQLHRFLQTQIALQ